MNPAIPKHWLATDGYDARWAGIEARISTASGNSFQMMEDTMDEILDNNEELEEQAQEEIDKVLFEVTAGVYNSLSKDLRVTLELEVQASNLWRFQVLSETHPLRFTEISRNQEHRRSKTTWSRCENDYRPSKVRQCTSFTDLLERDVQ